MADDDRNNPIAFDLPMDEGRRKRPRLSGISEVLHLKQKVIDMKDFKGVALRRLTPYYEVARGDLWARGDLMLQRADDNAEEFASHMHRLQCEKSIGPLAADVSRVPPSPSTVALLAGTAPLLVDLADVGMAASAITRDLVLIDYPGANGDVLAEFDRLQEWLRDETPFEAVEDWQSALQTADLNDYGAVRALGAQNTAVIHNLKRFIARGNALEWDLGRFQGFLFSKMQKLADVSKKMSDRLSFLERVLAYDQDIALQLPGRTCFICLETVRFSLLFCDSCDSAVCSSCAPGVVDNYCASADRVYARGNLICLACGEHEYSTAQLKKHLDDVSFDKYISAKEEASVTKALQRAGQAGVGRSSGNTNVLDFAAEVASTLKTLSCPHCGQAFIDRDPDECLALQCARCRRYFCGWCTAAVGSADEGHRHIAKCKWKPPHLQSRGDPFHASNDDWREGVGDFISHRLNIFLNALPAHMREEVQRRAA